MARPKGIKKTGGRQPGSPNRTTAELRQRITTFLDDQWPSLVTEFEGLDPKDKLVFWEKLLQYALPKLQSETVAPEAQESIGESAMRKVALWCEKQDLKKTGTK